MSALERYQAMVDAKTKPGKKVDLTNDDLTYRVESTELPKTRVTISAGPNSSYLETKDDELPLVLTHERAPIAILDGEYPIDPFFKDKTKEEKQEYVNNLQYGELVENIKTVWNSSGFFQWYASSNDLLYYGGSIIIDGFQNKARMQFLPWLSEMAEVRGKECPVLWSGPVETVIPVELLEKAIDPNGTVRINDKWSISFTWSDQGLTGGRFDWSGRYGSPGGVFIAADNLNGKSDYDLHAITLTDEKGALHPLHLHIKELPSNNFWGIPDEEGYKSHYEPGTVERPIKLDQADLEIAGCWVFLRNVVDGLTQNDLEGLFGSEDAFVDLGADGRFYNFERRFNTWYCLYDFGIAGGAYRKGETKTLDWSQHDPRLGKMVVQGEIYVQQ